jgi:uncharacterized phage-like protein YoqJ
MKQATCCITGHPINKFTFRVDEAQEDCVKLKMKLAFEIEEMRKKGVTTFLTSMAQTVGIWGAEIVLDFKRVYPDEPIRLVVITINKKRLSHWPQNYRNRYFDILTKADNSIILQMHYAKNPSHSCGCFMTDVSGHMIAVWNGMPGATRHAVNYARKNGLEIVLINSKI